MDESQVLQSLDSLWFYTDIFTHSDDPLPSLSPTKCDSDTPHSPVLNLREESDEIVDVNNAPCEPETEVRNRGGGGGGRKRRKRRKRSERHETRKVNGDGWGFDKKKPLTTNGPFRLNPASWTLPYDDEIAMKEHLKSWAYAVACIVK